MEKDQKGDLRKKLTPMQYKVTQEDGTEPAFNNAAGTVTFGGGSPTPFTANSNIMTVTFRAVANGTANVTFGETSALAADGRGTDVFESATNGSYVIAAATTPTPTRSW